ncbi:hypothetical protein BpHYR1_009765 [Brachionus plicatilis]|uniref:Uncharacterized protein n=1 Tax=Brachionus plicatilis TaxID=10195 RepID=A0A3M7TA36_BRAPC|nr:hypothetical protein BpHYR1_009765 [Brachionus plicatilis]
MNHLILVLDKSKNWPQNEQSLRFPWNQIVWKEKLSIEKEFLLIIKCLICINTRRFSYAYTIFKYCGIKQAIKKIIWKLRKNVPIFHFFKLTASHMRDLKLKEELELIILRKISKLNSKKISRYKRSYTKNFEIIS